MSHCPRCVRPVPADTVRCPHCSYDIPPLEVAPTLATPASAAAATPVPASSVFAPSASPPASASWSVPIDELVPVASEPFAGEPAYEPFEARPAHDAAPVYDQMAYEAANEAQSPYDLEPAYETQYPPSEAPIDPDQTEVIRLPAAPRLIDRLAPSARSLQSTVTGATSRLVQITRSPRSDEERRARLIIGAAAAAVLIVIVVVVVFSTLSGSRSPHVDRAAAASSTPAPTASSPAPQTAQEQATTLSGYLSQSAAARSGVSDAISSIGACRNVTSAVATLTNAADTRSRILASLATAQTSALPQGSTMVTDLRQALQASAQADQHYADWGTASATCSGTATHNADYTAGQQSDSTATAAKQRFIQSWNAVATQYNLAQQTASTF